ncbi:MAG: hypothetical protein V3U63_04355 [Gemmatimonadota bacterium]
MSEAARYKQKARAFEQRENWKRAIEAYELAIREDKKARRDVDLTLYNRIGDLYRRVGDVNKSVHYWDAAVDGHISAGFYNNAIALCNKVLRNQPNHHSIYLKLGKIGAAKGFLSDARRHFLEYAERMQKANKLDAAFDALIDFADISPDPEVRILIADQLLGHTRKDEAVDQLRLAWRDMSDEGREADAEEVRRRIIQLAPHRDPKVDPPAAGPVSAVEDAVGVIELPELEPLPLYDPDEAIEEKAESLDVAADIEPTALVEDEDEAFEESAVSSDDAIGVMPTALVDEDEVDAEVGEPLDDALDLVPTTVDAEEEAEEERELEEELAFEPAAGEDLGPGVVEDLGVETVEGLETTDEGPEPPVEEELDLEAERPTAAAEIEALDEDNRGIAGVDVDAALEDYEEEGIEAGLAAAVEEALDAVVDEGQEAAQALEPPDHVAELRGRLESDGRAPDLLVELADALLEVGGREEATGCLHEALGLYSADGQLNEASSVIAELLQLDINDLTAHQKRVELALRGQNPATLIETYLDLADCLDRTESGNKARIVYARVVELDPINRRALAALELFGDGAAPAVPGSEAGVETAAANASSDFVDLAALVREEQEVKSTRFTVPTVDPTSEGEVNFSEMLSQFKSKVAEAIEDEDASSHYDLGVAFKEMGLLDEAIAEFQIAARGLDYRLRAIEMLGTCFVEKQEYAIALKVLGRALQMGQYRDEELIAIFYTMGSAYEALGYSDRALEWFERVMGCDVKFADAAQRVANLRD